MNQAYTCLNLYRFTKKMEEVLPFPVTLDKLAILSCVYDCPRYIRSISKLTGLTQRAVSISIKDLSGVRLLRKTGSGESPFEITNLGENLLSAFYQAVTGGVFYEAPRTTEPVPEAKGGGPSPVTVQFVSSPEPDEVDGASPYQGEKREESLDFCLASW